ncbi:SDR family NAD(P)-dependent oxidoreductase [Portibacter marinus]|uniref:SDR family NAD(P)-dependent oxidoreductase n=1 Tax=Portibacter marinus TaxID=2898660 RepID=UPI001F2F32B2|nr:SDR family oxidoreductase [Portibacter marinus]
MNIDFSNKNVIITGGSRGIGKAIAKLFSEASANVIFTYHSNHNAAQETMLELSGTGKHRHYELNIANPTSVSQFVDQVIKAYGAVDILINNAGVFIEHKLAEIDFAEWQNIWNRTINTNLTGVSNLCYLVARQMINSRKGKIINISSRGAFRGEPNCPAYGASKAGLNALSQSLAQYLAPYNIRVGVIAPGFVETEMVADLLDSPAGEQIKDQSPLKRAASPEEIARVVALSAMEGIDYMTGSIIDVNGASYLRS